MAGFTYDLVKLHAQVKDILPPGTSFCVEIEVWDHAHADAGVSVECSIYDASSAKGMHFKGPTPDVALALLRAHYEALDMQPADLGLVAVPESVEVEG
ncbi:MAG: hypothetical protein Q8R92_05545 [Deltaproteobacteria bacterium]|nr:hypothetical protein [Deltaproteobacteria bacterium]